MHWVAVFDLGDSGGPDAFSPDKQNLTMSPATRFGDNGSDVTITLDTLERFRRDAEFLSVPFMFFSQFMSGTITGDGQRAALREIFLKKPLDDSNSKSTAVGHDFDNS